MNKKIYDMANDIVTDFSETEEQELSRKEVEKYEAAFQKRLKTRESKAAGRGKGRNKSIKRGRSLKMAVCAASAVIVIGIAASSSEVHAALEQLQWTIGNALGLQEDLADYKEVVNTTAMDGGYAVTLHEVVVTESEVWVNVTVRREDGQPLDISAISPIASIKVNGRRVLAGGGGGLKYLDEEQTIVGIEMCYNCENVDLVGETAIDISFRQLDIWENIKGKWDFSFTADASALMKDTRHIALNRTFTLPNGVTVTLDEFTSNDLEQRINFSADDKDASRYDMKVIAKDESGKEYPFYMNYFGGGSTRKGYMRLLGDMLPEAAGQVEMTFYVVAMPEQSGKMSNDFQQLGESFLVDFGQMPEAAE